MLIDEIIERYPEEEIIKADGYDEAIIGIDENTMRLIYSIKECINILIEKEKMSREDALEHFYFNTFRAYIGAKTPIWCQDDFE